MLLKLQYYSWILSDEGLSLSLWGANLPLIINLVDFKPILLCYNIKYEYNFRILNYMYMLMYQ